MMPGQVELLLAMLPEDREVEDPELLLLLLECGDPAFLKLQFPQRYFDRDFPKAGSAPKELIFPVFDRGSCLLPELIGIG